MYAFPAIKLLGLQANERSQQAGFARCRRGVEDVYRPALRSSTEAYRPAVRKSRDKFAFGISRLGALHGDPRAQLRIDGYRIRRAPGARGRTDLRIGAAEATIASVASSYLTVREN